MSVATANTAGHTKKITTNAMLLIGYCLGNFVGPFFFKTEQAPVYPLGVGMMFFCIAVQILSLVGIGVLFWYRNKSRREFHAEIADSGHHVLATEKALRDETDFQNQYFKVSIAFKLWSARDFAHSWLTIAQYVF